MNDKTHCSDPSVSVVIPARNAESTIEKAVRSCLGSAWVGEVIIVNDGSSDATAEQVSKLRDQRLRLIEGPCRGISAALNAGFAACRFPFVARCDADDSVESARFEWQVPVLQDSAVVAVSGAFTTVDSRDAIIAELAAEGVTRDVTELLRAGETITHLCTWLTRRQALQDCGGAREWFRTAEDIDLQFRLASLGRVIHVPRPAYRYCLHDQSITHTQGSLQRQFYEQTAREFARQRTETGSDSLDRDRPPECPTGVSDPHSAGKNIAGQLIGRAWQCHAQGKRWMGVKTLLRAVRHDPSAGLALTRQIAIMLVRKPGRGSKETPANSA